MPGDGKLRAGKGADAGGASSQPADDLLKEDRDAKNASKTKIDLGPTVVLTPAVAGKQARQILNNGGTLSYEPHATGRMEERDITTVDVVNVLLGGQCYEPGEHEGSCVRYRFHTEKFIVVIFFRSNTEVRVKTTMRKPQRRIQRRIK